MAKQFPMDIKQPFTKLPIGTLEMRIADAVENMIGKEFPLYGVQVSLEVTAPGEAAGLGHTENFIFGTEEDPGDLQNGVAVETFAERAGRFDQFCQKVGEQGIDIRGGDLLQVLAALKDQHIKAVTQAAREPEFHQYGKRKGQKNQYAGQWRVTPRWLALDEGGEVGITTTLEELEAQSPAPAPSNGGGGMSASQRPAAPPPPSSRTTLGGGMPQMGSTKPPAAPVARAAAPAPPAARRAR